jgi:hypothetical protein
MKPFPVDRPHESTAERDHSKLAKAYGWMVVKILRAIPNAMPDRFYACGGKHFCSYCGRGRVTLLEWKVPGKGPSRQQAIRIAELKRAGVEVHVVSSVVEANRILGIGVRNDE